MKHVGTRGKLDAGLILQRRSKTNPTVIVFILSTADLKAVFIETRHTLSFLFAPEACMATWMCFDATQIFESLAFDIIAHICQHTIVYIFDSLFTEPTFIRLPIGLILLTSFSKMIRCSITAITENKVTLGAIHPMLCHMLRCLIWNSHSLLILVAKDDITFNAEENVAAFALFNIGVRIHNRLHLPLFNIRLLLFAQILVVLPTLDLLFAETTFSPIDFFERFYYILAYTETMGRVKTIGWLEHDLVIVGFYIFSADTALW